jgi:arsenical-resistance protein 2
MIRGSINLPAQSLYHTIPALYRLFKAANLVKVIWFCGKLGNSPLTVVSVSRCCHRLSSRTILAKHRSGSSRGRGTRAAGWFADYLKERNEQSMESFILEGGIKGWVAGGKQFWELMDGYEESAWQ